MKKGLALLAGFVCVVSPALACADTLTPAQLQVEHLTAVVAALQAEIKASNGQSLACSLVSSTSTVSANRVFFLAWGSVGALAPGSVPGKSMYPQQGVNIMDIKTPGLWTYSFDFYGSNNSTTTCTTSILVRP